MNRIRLLPDHIANQIAAGEVVERPASVVKELVENAVDAQATRITVEIQAGGRSLVRVTDDGTGMSKDDALLCLERHATSKIQKAEDLASISTMGFRGEALPSIASVSRFVLTTRERESEDSKSSPEATQIVVNGGKIVEVKAAGAPHGTCIEVRQVFFNLPARRKFLRSEETESSHIQHYLTLAALAYPGVAFTFVKDGRTVWQLPPAGNPARLEALRARIHSLYGSQISLLALEHSGDLLAPTDPDNPLSPPARSGANLWGFIGAPGVSRATREEQHVFVNKRPVENRGINAALIEGYHTALMKGRFPVCCLFLEIEPASVDVNIHPAKREVKFHGEQAVRGFVRSAVKLALMRFHNPQASAPPDIPQSLPPQLQITPDTVELPAPLQPTLPAVPSQMPLAGSDQVPLDVAATPLFNRQSVQPTSRAHRLSGEEPVLAPAPIPLPVPEKKPDTYVRTDGEPTPLLRVPLRLVGVVGRLYVVLESDRGLVLLDQHAAHERILFEQMMARLEHQESAASQRLLLPETVELPPRDAHFLREHLPILSRLGVGLSEFGERTFLLDGLPPFIKSANPREFVMGLVDELKAAGLEVNTLRLGEAVVAKTVCRHAVKANDPLAGMELENLINELRHCSMPYTCPHGRPTMIEMNFRELEKKFGRIQ